METIREGVIPAPTQPWWVGEQITCDYCGYIGKLVAADESSLIFNNVRTPGGKATVRRPCPTCGKQMELSPPRVLVPKSYPQGSNDQRETPANHPCNS